MSTRAPATDDFQTPVVGLTSQAATMAEEVVAEPLPVSSEADVPSVVEAVTAAKKVASGAKSGPSHLSRLNTAQRRLQSS